jgi:hypothetical protein
MQMGLVVSGVELTKIERLRDQLERATGQCFKHDIAPGGELWPLGVNFDP